MKSSRAKRATLLFFTVKFVIVVLVAVSRKLADIAILSFSASLLKCLFGSYRREYLGLWRWQSCKANGLWIRRWHSGEKMCTSAVSYFRTWVQIEIKIEEWYNWRSGSQNSHKTAMAKRKRVNISFNAASLFFLEIAVEIICTSGYTVYSWESTETYGAKQKAIEKRYPRMEIFFATFTICITSCL